MEILNLVIKDYDTIVNCNKLLNVILLRYAFDLETSLVLWTNFGKALAALSLGLLGGERGS